MKTIAILANTGKPRADVVLRRIERKAHELGWRILTEAGTAALLPQAEIVPAPEMFDRAEAVMALGGDGTMLRVVRQLEGRQVPVIGVNIGSLGFLTSVAEDEIEHGLECLAAGRCTVCEWAVADCTVRRGSSVVGRYRALNDVVLRCGASPRVVTLEVRINGDYVTSYTCDGLIVSTPAGSTGHSLSSGGPILSPLTPALVVSLICPHTLSSRPLVVPDTSVIEVRAVEGAETAMISVDGQVGEPLTAAETVEVRRSAQGVRFIHLPDYSYFGVLRKKLRWSGSSV